MPGQTGNAGPAFPGRASGRRHRPAWEDFSACDQGDHPCKPEQHEPHPRRGPSRARVLSVDSYDVELDLTRDEPRSRRRPSCGSAAPSPERSTFIDLVAATVREVDAQRPAPRPGRGLRRHPDHAGRPGGGERAARRRRLPLHEHRRGPAPVRRPGRQGGLPLHAVRGGRRPADVRRLRAARPQGRASRSRCTAPADWQVVSNAPTPSPEPAAGRARRPGGSRPPRGCPPTSPRWSPARTTASSDEYRTGDRVVPLALFCRRRSPSTSTPTRSSR